MIPEKFILDQEIFAVAEFYKQAKERHFMPVVRAFLQRNTTGQWTWISPRRIRIKKLPGIESAGSLRSVK